MFPLKRPEKYQPKSGEKKSAEKKSLRVKKIIEFRVNKITNCKNNLKATIRKNTYSKT